MTSKKSKSAKFIAGVLGFAMALSLIGVTPASAQNVSDLMAQINSFSAIIASLQAQLAAVQGTTPAGSASCSFVFTSNLTVGGSGADVMNLQKVLNMKAATKVAASGAGSPGYETSKFGPATKAAVIKFQLAHGVPGTGFVGALTREALNAVCSSLVVTQVPGVVTPTGSDLSVMLSSDTPANSALIAGQAIGDLAHYTFTNRTSSDVKVTSVVLMRTGVSNDASLTNVYLYEGAKRLTDSATPSQTKITFNDASGLFTVGAGQSKVISVRADILGGISGQVIGVSLTGVTASVPVSGTMPIASNSQVISTATLGTIDYATSVTPSTASVDPQEGYVMWQNTVTIGTRAAWLKSVSFRQIGSVLPGDLQNFKFMVDGVQVGGAVASLDANNYVTFDLTANPLRLETGSRTFKLVGDIVGGSNRNFSFSLRQPGDAVFVDSELNQPILPTVASATFSARSTLVQSVNVGTLSIVKAIDSASGNTTLNASNVSLGKFTIKAAGESMKIENLVVGALFNGSASTTASLRNGALYANGVQVGSTATLSGAAAGTQFNLGSSLVVMPGSPVTLEVRADIYDNNGTNDIASGDTVTAKILAGSSNVQQKVTLAYISNTSVSGNALTVSVGTLTMSKDSSYANQTTVVPQTAFKIADFNLTANDTESINLDTILVSIREAGNTDIIPGNIQDLYVKYGSVTTSMKSTLAATASSVSANTFSISATLAPNQSIPVEVYATLNTGSLTGSTTIATVTVSGTTAQSSASKTSGAVTGQTITVAAGSISSLANQNSILPTRLLVGGTTPRVATFKLNAINDSYVVTDFAVKVPTAGTGNVASVTFKFPGSSQADKTVALQGTIATSTGLSLAVAPGTSGQRSVDVYLNLADVGTNAATTSADVKVTLEGFISNSSTGTRAENATDSSDTNSQYVVKSVPTIANVSLGTSALNSSGTQKIAKISISPDAAGSIGWKEVAFSVSKTSGVTLGAPTTLSLYDVTDSGSTLVAGTFSTSTVGYQVGESFSSASTAGTLRFVATNEQTVSSTRTYEVRGTAVTYTNSTGTYSLSLNVAQPSVYAQANTYAVVSATTPSFVWSDQSVSNPVHSETTADWMNDYKAPGLPTDSQTLSASV